MKKGFTLLEILLVIAAIGILAAIVIIAINPLRQLAQVRNIARTSDINSIQKAIEQYSIDSRSYPSSITNTYQELCVDASGGCVGLLDLITELSPDYIAQIPQDPLLNGDGSGYEVAINPDNQSISVRVINPELGQIISLNEIQVATVGSYGWGDNTYGQHANGDNTPTQSPRQATSDNDWVDIAAGDSHIIALKSDGTLWAAGRNHLGQLGDGTTQDRNSFVQVGTDTDWAQITANSTASAAIKTNGTLWWWGDVSISGRPFDPSGNYPTDEVYVSSTTPVQIGTDTDWENLSLGITAILMTKTNGEIYGVGVGDGHFDGGVMGRFNYSHTSPVQIDRFSGPATDWDQLVLGQTHVLSIKDNGTLWAWGNNRSGQLGIGSTSTGASIPSQVGSDTDWDTIAATALQSYAIKSDGTLWGWGDDNSGIAEIGNGSSDVGDQNTPIQIGTDTDWLSIDGGMNGMYALKTDNTLWTWGIDTAGELGQGATGEVEDPTQVGVIDTWQEAAGGVDFGVGLAN